MSMLGIHTTAGSAKSVNQDACCFKEAVTPWGTLSMALVCDGVGGMEMGEFASSTIVWRFADWFENDLLDQVEQVFSRGNRPQKQGDDERALPPFERIGVMFENFLERVHSQLNGYAQEQGVSFGSTFTGMLVLEHEYSLVHVGDSRAYELKNGVIHQITTDHTLVADLVRQGRISADEALSHPKRNVITKAVGVSKSLGAEVQQGSFDEGVVFLLCSDGFYKELTEDEIASAFSTGEELTDQRIIEAERALTQQAMDRGEKDNITVLVFSLQVTSQGAMPVDHDEEDDFDTATVSSSDDEEDESNTVVVSSGDDEDDSDTVIVSPETVEDSNETVAVLSEDAEDVTTTMIVSSDDEEDVCETVIVPAESPDDEKPSEDREV